MYRIMIILIGVLLSLPLLADPAPQENFYWVKGQTDLPVIKLGAVTEAQENVTWFYSYKCLTQKLEAEKKSETPDKTAQTDTDKQPPTAQKLFDCTLKDSNLEITLTDGVVGTGTIEITAVAMEQNAGTQRIVDTKNFYYSVEVIEPVIADPKECKSWDCSLFTAFYMGYEGTSVSNVNQKGNLRLQYTGYSQVMNHLHVYGDLLQTSLQEQSATQESCTADPAAEGCDVDATIAANLGFYAPFELGVGLQIGPMLEYNVQKLDSDDRFAKSYYGGIRFAYSKIRFFNIGYGKSEGIPGERIEFTGQLPMYNDKLIAGMVLNVSVDDTAEEQGVSSGDSINVYIMTRVDFTQIFTSFTK